MAYLVRYIKKPSAYRKVFSYKIKKKPLFSTLSSLLGDSNLLERTIKFNIPNCKSKIWPLYIPGYPALNVGKNRKRLEQNSCTLAMNDILAHWHLEGEAKF